MTSEDVGPFIVSTEDGERFHCSVAPIGPSNVHRWIMIDSKGMGYIGPAWTGTLLEPQLRALVTDWWREKRARRAS